MTAPSLIWALFLAAVHSLLACTPQNAPAAGGLEVVQTLPSDAGCAERRVPRSGGLELTGLDAHQRTVVSMEELTLRGTASRRLPAGLYSVEWVPGADARAPAARAAWVLPRPAVVMVVPGRVARLTVRIVPAECASLDAVET